MCGELSDAGKEVAAAVVEGAMICGVTTTVAAAVVEGAVICVVKRTGESSRGGWDGLLSLLLLLT